MEGKGLSGKSVSGAGETSTGKLERYQKLTRYMYDTLVNFNMG